jgi:hypothetical protein
MINNEHRLQSPVDSLNRGDVAAATLPDPALVRRRGDFHCRSMKPIMLPVIFPVKQAMHSRVEKQAPPDMRNQ